MVYYEGIDYWVRRVEFPNMASESVVVSHGDGTFTIYINTLFCEERQQECLEHELRHLEAEHFYRDDMSIQQIERQADRNAAAPQEAAAARLPNVFTEAPPNTIPIFNSLDTFKDYMFAMREQVQQEKTAGG